MNNPFEIETDKESINKNTAITLIIDRSGSMTNIWNNTVEGFKEFINGQKQIEGKTFVRLVVFDSEIIEAQPYTQIKNINENILEEFPPRGTTSLYDAVGSGIRGHNTFLDTFTTIGEEIPSNNILVIFTDGGENTSSIYNNEQIIKLLNEWENDNNKELIFLGAGSDAWNTGVSNLRIIQDSSIYYQQTELSTSGAWDVMNQSISNYRNMRNTLVDLDNVEDFGLTSLDIESNNIDDEGNTN